MKPKFLISALILSTGIILFTGCYNLHCIEGNGNLIEETRFVGSFDAVSSEGWFDVYLVQDTIEKVIVEAESNLMPYIYTWVKGNTLVIKEQKNRCLNNHFPIRITVHTMSLDFVELTGSGNIYGNTEFYANSFEVEITGSGNIDMDITANSIEATISGSGKIEIGANAGNIEGKISGSGALFLWGEADRTNLIISGSGDVQAYGLIQNTCFVKISGSGSVFVFVNDLLDVIITGSGSVFYKGNPQVSSTITGSGSIIHQP